MITHTGMMMVSAGRRPEDTTLFSAVAWDTDGWRSQMDGWANGRYYVDDSKRCHRKLIWS